MKCLEGSHSVVKTIPMDRKEMSKGEGKGELPTSCTDQGTGIYIFCVLKLRLPV